MNYIVNGVVKSATLYVTRTVQESIKKEGGGSIRIATRGVTKSLIMPDKLYEFVRMKQVVAQQHIAPLEYNLTLLRRNNYPKMITIIRDPRDVIVSWFHHITRDNLNIWEKDMYIAENLITENFYVLDKEEQLNILIDKAFEPIQQWIINWIDIYNANILNNFELVTYEDMVIDEEKFFKKLFEHFDIKEQRTTININKTLKIDPATHFRKGKIGSYKEELNLDQIDKINYLYNNKIKNFLEGKNICKN